LSDSRRIVVAANSAWNLVKLRAGLIRGLRERGFHVTVMSAADPSFEQALRELADERVVIPIDRSGLNPIADLRLLGAYRRQLRQLRPAAFLGFTIKPNIYGGIAARATGVPAIANVSGLGTAFIRGGALQWLVSKLYRFALRGASTVFFQNPDDRALFVERGLVAADRARLLPGSGIDVDRFEATALPEGPPVFLLIARLLGDKGVREFAQAARMLRAELPGARFQLLGPVDSGNRTAIGQAELDRWAGEGIVEHLGETDDVRPFIAEATAVLLPSYREGLPRVLLEGGAGARPLIATDVPGCREVVQDGVNGFLCEARSAVSLADAMRRLVQLSSAERTAMGLAARRRVQDWFSERAVVEAYLGALGKVGAAKS
jgi:glycosyltransferase involved in cell wall biosynthesis